MTPNTLREWGRRYGFPVSHPSPGGAREFVFDEVVALREALQGGLSVATAMLQARASLAAENADALHAAFVALDSERCVRLLEASLAFRSLEGAVEEVLLRALDMVARTHGRPSAQWTFASEFASDWIRHTIRQTWRPLGSGSILLARAWSDDVDSDAVYIRALELLCRLSGFDVVTLQVGDSPAVGFAAALQYPTVLLLAGSQLPDEYVDQWAGAVRAMLRPVAVAIYRRDLSALRLVGPLATPLSPSPSDARRELIILADGAYQSSLEAEPGRSGRGQL